MQFWKAALVQLQLIKVVVLDVELLQTYQVQKLT